MVQSVNTLAEMLSGLLLYLHSGEWSVCPGVCGRVVLGVELCLEGAQSGSKGCGTCDCEVSLTSLTVHNYTV